MNEKKNAILLTKKLMVQTLTMANSFMLGNIIKVTVTGGSCYC